MKRSENYKTWIALVNFVNEFLNKFAVPFRKLGLLLICQSGNST